MTQPTKADLAAAVAKLTEENAALFGIFAAIRDGADAHGVLPWIIGYAGNIGSDNYSRGNVRLLRAYARCLRRGPGCHAEHEGYYCNLRGGHDPARHEVHGDDGELIAAWDDEPLPVITDGEPWTRAGVAAAIVPAPSVPNPPYHAILNPGEKACAGPGWNDEAASGYVCTAQDGHDGPDHIAYKLCGGEYHRWPVVPAPSGMQDPAPVARVITDSERTCPEANPDSGAWCHRDGDHGVHRDPDGEEWRTDGGAPVPQCDSVLPLRHGGDPALIVIIPASETPASVTS